MKFEALWADGLILEELGRRLARRRIELQQTQAQLAEQAGVSKRSVERIEAGATTQMVTMIRILRVLELLERLEVLVPESVASPMDMIKLKGKERKRASSKKRTSQEGPWKWGDEE